MFHDVLQHGGHQHGAVGAVGLDQAHPLFGFKLAHYQHGSAAVDRRQGGLKTGDMVKRDGHQIGLFNIRVGRVDRGQQQPGEAFVAQHHALRHSGGAGGEHDYRGVIIVRLREVKLIGHGAGNQIVIADPSICGRPVQYDYPIGGHPFVGRD